jgi:hypothetical protein
VASLGQFAENMKRRAADVERNTSKTVRAVALVADRELVLQTPVDTGRARSNWIVTLGNPATKTIEPYSKGEKGSTGTANASAAIAQGAATISQRKEGQDISISNNLDYIGKLNEGSSAQAPAQFVQAAVQRAVAAVRKAKVL